jgi:hypothetical protein
VSAGTYRAGQSIEDFCRACKTDRHHTIIVVDGSGTPLRVTCDYCESQHNYRGGPRIDAPGGARDVAATPPATVTAAPAPRHERTSPPMSVPDRSDSAGDLESLLRRIIREEAGLTPAAPAAKWRGGTLVLRPANQTQEKSWPIDTFFHKVVMLRNRLRTLEQQVNASDLPEDVKVKLQGYVSGCYGSLTSFNVLFADEDDQFKGGSGD